MHRLQWEDLRGAGDPRPFVPRSLATDTFAEDVARLLGAIERAGAKQAIVIDLTRKEMPIPVVRVIVPGMRELVPPVLSDEDTR